MTRPSVPIQGAIGGLYLGIAVATSGLAWGAHWAWGVALASVWLGLTAGLVVTLYRPTQPDSGGKSR